MTNPQIDEPNDLTTQFRHGQTMKTKSKQLQLFSVLMNLNFYVGLSIVNAPSS